MLGKALTLSSLFAFVLLSAILQSTTPSTIHPVGILSVFVLLYVLALGVLTFCLYIFSRIISKTIVKRSVRQSLSLQKSYYYGSVLALAPVMILGIRSIGRTGVYDIVLIVLFEIIACFYITKRRS